MFEEADRLVELPLDHIEMAEARSHQRNAEWLTDGLREVEALRASCDALRELAPLAEAVRQPAAGYDGHRACETGSILLPAEPLDVCEQEAAPVSPTWKFAAIVSERRPGSR